MDIWIWIANISGILGIATFIFSGLTWVRVRSQARQLQLLVEAHHRDTNTFTAQREAYRGVQTTKPIALAMALTDRSHSIEQDVQRFLQAQQWNMEIVPLLMNGIVGDEGVAEFVQQARQARLQLEFMGATEIHLFVMGPVAAGIMVGALYHNWIPVKIYHKPTPAPPEMYEYWYPLP